jgi:hypothetical protein
MENPMLEDEDKEKDVQEEQSAPEPDNSETEVDATESSASSEKSEPEKKADDEEDELASYSEGVKKRINKLTYKAREAERREQEALEYAKAVKTELDEIRKRETSLSKSFESEAETRLSTQEQLYRDQLKFAVDSGDVDKQVEIQTNLVRLATERERLQNYRAYRQQEVEAPAKQIPPPPQPRQPSPDPKAQSWAERNAWFGKDRAMTQEALGIHEDLMQEGYAATDDDYYRELDKRIRQEFPHKFTQPTAKKPNNPVASARPTQVKRSSGDVELTDTQKTIAKRLGVSYDDYKRQLKLVQERV